MTVKFILGNIDKKKILNSVLLHTISFKIYGLQLIIDL